MKKAIVSLLILVLCLSLCACGAKNKTEYQLLNNLKIGDSFATAEEIFGFPIYSNLTHNPPEKMYYEYSPIEVYDLEFMPWIRTDESDNVLLHAYSYQTNTHSAAYDAVIEKIHQNLVAIYGEPTESEDNDYTWSLDDGTSIFARSSSFSNTYSFTFGHKKTKYR